MNLKDSCVESPYPRYPSSSQLASSSVSLHPATRSANCLCEIGNSVLTLCVRQPANLTRDFLKKVFITKYHDHKHLPLFLTSSKLPSQQLYIQNMSKAPAIAAQHELVDSPVPSSQSSAASLISPEGEKLGEMTILGRLLVFLLFPTAMGFVGLYVGYLETKRDTTKVLSFDQDFALPFALAMVMALVIGFQTSGFTSKKPKPLVAWPKIKKRRKVVHKHIVKGESIAGVEAVDDDDDDEVDYKEEDVKKND